MAAHQEANQEANQETTPQGDTATSAEAVIYTRFGRPVPYSRPNSYRLDNRSPEKKFENRRDRKQFYIRKHEQNQIRQTVETAGDLLNVYFITYISIIALIINIVFSYFIFIEYYIY